MADSDRKDWVIPEGNMKSFFGTMKDVLDEKQLRILEGGFANMFGYGG